MSYFSRLTDIVTCNLTQLLNQATDARAAIAEIVTEMQEGLAGAQRSVNTAVNAEQRLKREIDEHRQSAARALGQGFAPTGLVGHGLEELRTEPELIKRH